MRILIIIPIFNEEEYLEECLNSFINQSFSNFELVLVDDNSTDKTPLIIESFASKDSRISTINTNNVPNHQPGGKIINTFYKGLATKNIYDFDVIGKFDADIILPKTYLEEVVNLFQKNPKCGLAGGLLYVKKKNNWIYEGTSNKSHVRGPLKLYQRKCFDEMGGLRETIGWDNIDSLLLKINNWEEVVLPNLHVKLLKDAGASYTIKKPEYLGKYFYFLGLNRFLTYISAGKEGWKNKSFGYFSSIISHYNTCKKENLPLKISTEEQKWINKYRMDLIWMKLGLKQRK